MDKTRVLIVDDELDTLNLLKMLLEVSGFEPIATLNSVEAVALAELEKPDVILLDIMMPKLDGFALCKMMRQHPELKTRPIIFVTAYEALDLEERKKDAGADAIVNKPINMDKLTATIAEVRDTQKAARESAIQKAPPTAITPKAEVKPPAIVETKPTEIIPAETKDEKRAIEKKVDAPTATPQSKATQEAAKVPSPKEEKPVTPTPPSQPEATKPTVPPSASPEQSNNGASSASTQNPTSKPSTS